MRGGERGLTQQGYEAGESVGAVKEFPDYIL